MELFSKCLDILKIPLRILLPSMWLFSAFMIFSYDNILNKLNLLNWKNDNSFIFGLIFIMTSCLLLVYIFFFISKYVKSIWNKVFLKRKILKEIFDMDELSLTIILALYNSIGHTRKLDYCQPAVQHLLSIGYIYGGQEQLVSINPLNECMILNFTLRPIVYKTLKYYKNKIEKRIEKLDNKLLKTKNNYREKRLERKIRKYYDLLERFQED